MTRSAHNTVNIRNKHPRAQTRIANKADRFRRNDPLKSSKTVDCLIERHASDQDRRHYDDQQIKDGLLDHYNFGESDASAVTSETLTDDEHREEFTSDKLGHYQELSDDMKEYRDCYILSQLDFDYPDKVEYRIPFVQTVAHDARVTYRSI